jgi:hypothetical protein
LSGPQACSFVVYEPLGQPNLLYPSGFRASEQVAQGAEGAPGLGGQLAFTGRVQGGVQLCQIGQRALQ